jgi:hypothetical protein
MSAPTSFEPTPELAALMAAGPLLDSDAAIDIAREFYTARRTNEIREWNPAICGIVAHIFKKLQAAGTFAEELREKARTVAEKRQIEVPIFSYNRTFLRGDTKPWDSLDIIGSYTAADGQTVSYSYTSTVGDACAEYETTTSSLTDWVGGELPPAQRYIPLRKLLQADTSALGMLSVLLGPNTKVVQRVKPAHITTERYTVCKVELVAKMYLPPQGREDQALPVHESFDRARALQKWFPAPVVAEQEEFVVPVEVAADAEESTIDGCGYEWCDGSCGY